MDVRVWRNWQTRQVQVLVGNPREGSSPFTRTSFISEHDHPKKENFVNSTVEALEDNQLKITCTIPAADVDAQIKRTYKDFAKRYKFPGFRPGKAPRPVIDNMLGKDSVMATVAEDLVNTAYPQILDENDLVPLFKAEFSDAEAVEGKDLTFTATITVKPQVELTSYDPVDVEVPSTEATEEEIDSGVDEFRNYYMEYKDANANTKIKKDQFVELSMDVTDPEGEIVSALSCESRLYQLGQNLYPASFDAELIGLKKGDEKSFDLDMAGQSSLLSQSFGIDKGVYHFDVKIGSIKKTVLPEANDEFAKNLGFDDMAALRALVGEQIATQKESAAPRRKENECLFALAQRVTDEMPSTITEREEANLLQDLFRQLNQAGQSYDAFLQQAGITAEQLKEDIKKQAADTVRQDMALDAWARHFNIEATPEEVTQEFEKANLDDPAKVEAEWRETGRIPMIREGIKRSKALKDIAEKANVTIIEESAVAPKDAE